jgi:hypothetical protein
VVFEPKKAEIITATILENLMFRSTSPMSLTAIVSEYASESQKGFSVWTKPQRLHWK